MYMNEKSKVIMVYTTLILHLENYALTVLFESTSTFYYASKKIVERC